METYPNYLSHYCDLYTLFRYLRSIEVVDTTANSEIHCCFRPLRYKRFKLLQRDLVTETQIKLFWPLSYCYCCSCCCWHSKSSGNNWESFSVDGQWLFKYFQMVPHITLQCGNKRFVRMVSTNNKPPKFSSYC